MRLDVHAFVVILVLIFSGTSSHAQSLRDAVMKALDNHPVVEGAEAGKVAAEHGKKAELSNYYPEIFASAAFGRVYQDNSTSRGLVVERGAAYSGYGEGNVAMRQMMFDGLETKNRVTAADARLESQNYMLLDAQSEIIFRVVQTYIEIMRLRSALHLLSDQSKTIADYQKRIITMTEQGVADESELQQARDVAMVLETIRTDYEGRLFATRAAYNEVVGKMPPQIQTLPGSVGSYIGDNVDDVAEAAKVKHPMLLAARMDSKAARHDMKAEHGKMYPDVSGELSYYKSDKEDVIGGENKDARALVKMNWTFSTGGREFSEFRKKQSEHDAALHRFEELERQIELGIYQAYANHRTLQRKLKLSKERLDLNKKLVTTYKSQFEGSRINLLSLMRAESQFFKAKLEYSDNTYNFLLSEYDVLASIGELKSVILSVPEIAQAHSTIKGEDNSQ